MTTTKSKLMYRIFIYPNLFPGFEKLAILAAKHNGGGEQYTIAELAAIGKGVGSEYPASFRDTTIEQIGDNTLHIDAKVGDNYQTTLRIEQVEILEPIFTEE